MDIEQIEDIYYTLIGVMNEEHCVTGVENLFIEGSACQRAYSEMLAAYERLCKRLDAKDEDEDVEDIINSLMSIEKAVSMKMFEYGMKFANKG